MTLLIRFLLGGNLILLAVSLWQRNVLPEPSLLRSELQSEPIQVGVTRPAFQTKVNDITYTVRPLYFYELWGLVVSKHDSDDVADSVHRRWNDNLNVVDLCVIWGENTTQPAYRDMNFTSSPTWCFFETSSNDAYAAFDQTAISNNHLLTDNPAIAKQLHRINIGDQIHFRGYLAEYSHNHGTPFKRGTSVVRTDSGDGACETVYIEEIDILRRGGGPWRVLIGVAIGLLVLGLIIWYRAPIRANP